MRIIFKLFLYFAAMLGFIVMAGAGWIGFYFVYPNVAALQNENPKATAFMEYREKEAVEKMKKVKRVQTWVPLSQVSPFVVDAVVISEDDKFWQHEGFDFAGIQTALEKDLREGKMKAGGSTITQQLAKNLFLSPEKSPTRKLKEAILTFRLERTLTKRRILELYLNVAEWGDGLYGIEAAAQRHFHKPAVQLSPEEAARLAIALPNPRKINPAGSSRFVAGRVETVLGIMLKRSEGVGAYENLSAPEEAETE